MYVYCIYVCMHVRMYVHMHVCMYGCTRVRGGTAPVWRSADT